SMADLADHANELVLARLDGLLAARLGNGLAAVLAVFRGLADGQRRAAPGCSRCIDCQDRHERR
ncbi:TraR/DksA family transcriptional regulator, partial [Pseudomonas aeruginosa]|uniref:TraR/DksA family transcriptional regulator n=1 Tax=Pseudomonas aeruginosa TaxID=287 RepID=UPI0039E0AA0C